MYYSLLCSVERQGSLYSKGANPVVKWEGSNRSANRSALHVELSEKALTGLQDETQPLSSSSRSARGAEAQQNICQVAWHKGS